MFIEIEPFCFLPEIIIGHHPTFPRVMILVRYLYKEIIFSLTPQPPLSLKNWAGQMSKQKEGRSFNWSSFGASPVYIKSQNRMTFYDMFRNCSKSFVPDPPAVSFSASNFCGNLSHCLAVDVVNLDD